MKVLHLRVRHPTCPVSGRHPTSRRHAHFRKDRFIVPRPTCAHYRLFRRWQISGGCRPLLFQRTTADQFRLRTGMRSFCFHASRSITSLDVRLMSSSMHDYLFISIDPLSSEKQTNQREIRKSKSKGRRHDDRECWDRPRPWHVTPMVAMDTTNETVGVQMLTRTRAIISTRVAQGPTSSQLKDVQDTVGRLELATTEIGGCNISAQRLQLFCWCSTKYAATT